MNLSIINLFNFQKKVIVITGSSGYLGSKLVKLYRDLNSTVYEIDFIKPKNFHKKYYYKASVDKNKIFKIIYSIVNKEKKIDVLINNGGISYFDHFLDRTNKQIYETFEKNYKTTFEIIRAYAKIHIKNKLTKCSIINVSSVYGNISPDFNIYSSKKKHNSEIYGASKAAIQQMSKYLAVQLAPHGININCISPGGIYKKKSSQDKKFIKNYSKKVPIGRMANIDDLYSSFLFFSSEYSSYVTGQNLIIDGGMSL